VVTEGYCIYRAKAKKLGLTHLIKKIKSKHIPEKNKEKGDILYTQEV
jgi:hypothetical protein